MHETNERNSGLVHSTLLPHDEVSSQTAAGTWSRNPRRRPGADDQLLGVVCGWIGQHRDVPRNLVAFFVHVTNLQSRYRAQKASGDYCSTVGFNRCQTFPDFARQSLNKYSLGPRRDKHTDAVCRCNAQKVLVVHEHMVRGERTNVSMEPPRGS